MDALKKTNFAFRPILENAALKVNLLRIRKTDRSTIAAFWQLKWTRDTALILGWRKLG